MLIGVLCAVVLGFVVAASALAAPPAHAPLADPLAGFSLDKACGTAVDSEGDVYVSSAGNDAIEVFNPAGGHLTTIANTNEPCGLAVDSKGNLYASESATGEVVRYAPSVYPFASTPTYGAPTTVDSSGQAKGIAVDPFDDRVYVAEGDHIAAYQSDGTLGINEVQMVKVNGATGGTFTLSFKGEETDPIDFDATHAELGAALEALSTIGAGNVSISEGSEGPSRHLVTFLGAVGSADVPGLVADASGLIDGSVDVVSGSSSSETLQGWSGRIGDGVLGEATGVAVYRHGSDDRYVFAADPDGAAADKVRVFGGASVDGLKLRATLDGSRTPDSSFGFGSAGASLGVDRVSGHLFVYDDAHQVVDEFEATGSYVTQIDDSDFDDAEPTGIAVHPQYGEIQRVAVDATGGTFTLAFEGEETLPITYKANGFAAYEATAARVEAALEALPTIGTGNVSVAGIIVGGTPTHLRVVFAGALGNHDLSQLIADGSELTGGASTATVFTERDGFGPGRVYVSAGASAGARLLAFGPSSPPSRPPLPTPSLEETGACGIAIDSHGDIYVAVGKNKRIDVFDPSGGFLKAIPTPSGEPCALAVDSAGSLYANLATGVGNFDLLRYTPDSYPPTSGVTYSSPQTIVSDVSTREIAINLSNDHIFITVPGGSFNQIREYDSAANGSGLINEEIGAGLVMKPQGIDIYAETGDIYVGDNSIGEGDKIKVLDPTGTELLAAIDGGDSPRGPFGNMNRVSLAVDQANGHVLVGDVQARGTVEEFEASGTFVAKFGSFSNLDERDMADIALDNSGGPNHGNLYVADSYPAGDDVTAFGPLAYGEPPIVSTGFAADVGAGSATLNGTVNPRGEELTSCRFEYVTQSQFDLDGFASATSETCVQTPAEIGSGGVPIAVHADVSGLSVGERYRFRLVAVSPNGTTEGNPAVFGPPLHTPKAATDVLYTEARLNATIDPSGLPTSYRFEYGKSPCDANPCSQTAMHFLPAGTTPQDVQVPVFGLDENVTYHFRLLAENDAGPIEGVDQTLTTLVRPAPQSCANAALRAQQHSEYLLDCRAYELVTPADTHGRWPHAAAAGFNSWFASPGGDSLVFMTDGTIPGTDGNGVFDAHRARRGPAGWSSELISPAGVLGSGGPPTSFEGIASDHAALSWHLLDGGSLPPGRYLSASSGLEPLGKGSFGADLAGSLTQFISPGAEHVIFVSSAHLEPTAPPAGTGAIYDRSPGGPTHVVSLLPGEATPAAGENAVYQGTSADGSAVAFKVGATLYVRRDNAETVEVVTGPSTFAGFSVDGKRLFYADANLGLDQPGPAGLFAFELDSQAATQIAPNSRFIDVSADGSHVYFTSTNRLDDAEEGVPGKDNLYLWDGASIRFIAVLDSADFNGFAGDLRVQLGRWTSAIGPDTSGTTLGRADSPARTSPDGEALVFQSHGNLTAYDSGGRSEVYRYDAADQSLLCVSCPQASDPATADAELQQIHTDTFDPLYPTTIIPNVSEDGDAAFFETAEALTLADRNNAVDVYGWRAEGSGACKHTGGCLGLISGGRGDEDSHLYGMSADGRDVYFFTHDTLIDTDLAGPSIYDARLGGGFAPPAPPPGECLGEACQPAINAPDDPTPASSAFKGPGNAAAPPSRPRCPKSKHRVTRRGKSRCVPRHRGKKQSQRKRHNRRTAR